ncbi:hypothetical protein [Longispora albida]|uniref:hypothetical protein n=1 Tax=Longispora albida TaxID=203523 RepID=UPI0003823034|nr:hypothetical protein [Longispora albida]
MRTVLRTTLAAAVTAAAILSALVGATSPAQAESTVGGKITRTEVIQRAESWVGKGYVYDGDDNPPEYTADGDDFYKDPQDRLYLGDCSGYVSMALHLGTTLTSYGFRDNNTLFTTIDRSQLLPGDVLATGGHVNLFAGYEADGVHFAYYSFGSTNAIKTKHTGAYFDGDLIVDAGDRRHYTARRYKNIDESAPVSVNTDLNFIQTSGTGSGKVELRSATTSTGYSGAGTSHITRFGTGAATANGSWQLSASELMFVQTTGTGSGKVELHNATAASGYATASTQAITYFSSADSGNGVWQMVGSDLYFIKLRNTGSGKIEVHTATAASGYASGSHFVTRFGTGAAVDDGVWQISAGDLYFVKLRNTGTGKIELHLATGATGFTGAASYVTRFGTGPATADGTWQLAGRDLYFVKVRNTGTGKIELHTATGATGYAGAGSYVTRFGTGAAVEYGTWQLGLR